MQNQSVSGREVPKFIDIDEIKTKTLSNKNSLIIGLTGSIASGKTTVANMFKRCIKDDDHRRLEIIDFDILARAAVEPGTKGLAGIVSCFGPGIIDSNGYLDRKALSQIVFKDNERRKELERLIHPAIFGLFFDELNRISGHDRCCLSDSDTVFSGQQKQDSSASGEQALLLPVTRIIAVVPLLVEMNLQSIFHKIVVVHVSSDIQLRRLMQRENIGKERAEAMIRSQVPVDLKIKYADFLINNSGDIENTFIQVQDVWKKL